MKKIKRITAILLIALMVSLTAGIAAFAASETITATVNVGTGLTMTVDKTAIDFGTAVAGTTNVTNPPNSNVTATITSPSFNFSVSLHGTDLVGQTDAAQVIPISNMSYAVTPDGLTGTSGTVSSTSTVILNNQPTTAAGGRSHLFEFSLDIPAGVSEQQYAGSVIIEASTI